MPWITMCIVLVILQWCSLHFTSRSKPDCCEDWPSHLYCAQALWDVLLYHIKSDWKCFLKCLNVRVFYRNKMKADKQGIKITSEPAANNGLVQLFVPNPKETSIITFHITNEGPNQIYFTCCIPITRIDCFTLEDEKDVNRERPLLLSAGEATSTQHLLL